MSQKGEYGGVGVQTLLGLLGWVRGDGEPGASIVCKVPAARLVDRGSGLAWYRGPGQYEPWNGPHEKYHAVSRIWESGALSSWNGSVYYHTALGGRLNRRSKGAAQESQVRRVGSRLWACRGEGEEDVLTFVQNLFGIDPVLPGMCCATS